MGTHPIFESDFDCLTEGDCMTDKEQLPEFSPSDNSESDDSPQQPNSQTIRRLQQEASALKGGQNPSERKLYALLGQEMKILISDNRVLVDNSHVRTKI